MNSKQNKILKAIFEKPTRKNILWSDIERLFVSLGAEIINKGGSVVTIRLGGRVQTFHRPHPSKEAPAYCIHNVRLLLMWHGVKL